MKAIITGASGAVGSALRRYLESSGHTAIPWNRTETPIDDYAAMQAFVRAHQPDALFHLAVASTPTGRDNESWLVNYHWTGELAWLCREENIRFLFSSSVMVYTNDAVGPFTPDTPPDAREGYGAEKLQAEQRALSQNPAAVIVRLGWQIGDAPYSNNMIDFLEKQHLEQREIRASRRWFPACSFVGDSAAALTHLMREPGGIYLADSNLGWTFYDIANALNTLHGSRWTILPDDALVYDQRMRDPRVSITPLNARLPELPPPIP